MKDTFATLGIDSELLEALTEMGFERPMPVQAQVIPLMLASDQDLIALAQTGTGKTAAFGLPLIQKLIHDGRQTEALILSPTRELCMQITQDLERMSSHKPWCRITAVYGGASIENQVRDLKKGAAIVVATPGRALDLIRRSKLKVDNIRMLVLDEADEMLNMGFKEELDAILSQTPSEKSSYLFSATMPKEVARIAQEYMHQAQEITVGERNSGSDSVEHVYYTCASRERYAALKRILDAQPDIYAIVFCRTRAECQDISESLLRDGYNAGPLHGDLSQAQRDTVMRRFKQKTISILVATDVAARGIDVQNLSHVINYNLPNEPEQYTHRSGRTGRADKKGISIAILTQKELYKIRSLEKAIKKSFTQGTLPSASQVCQTQFLNAIDRLLNVSIDQPELDAILPELMTKLSDETRESLIKRFLALEHADLLSYLQQAPRLDAQSPQKDKKQREFKDFRDNADRGFEARPSRQRDRGSDSEDMTTLFFGLGRKDHIAPQRLIGLINTYLGRKSVSIGRIDLFEKHSHVDVDSRYALDVVNALSEARQRGRSLNVRVLENNKKSKRSYK